MLLFNSGGTGVDVNSNEDVDSNVDPNVDSKDRKEIPMKTKNN